MHVKGLGQLRQSSANVPEADDKERLAAEFVLSLGEIADHPPTDALALVVTGLGKTAAQREHQRHRVLSHRASIDPAGTGQPDAAPCQLVARELVGTGADDATSQVQRDSSVETKIAPRLMHITGDTAPGRSSSSSSECRLSDRTY